METKQHKPSEYEKRYEQLNHSHPFRCLLSWFVLILCATAVYFIENILLVFGAFALVEVEKLSDFAKLVVYLLGGITALSALLAPAIWGAIITVYWNNIICWSKSGVRYIVISAICIFGFGVSSILGLSDQSRTLEIIANGLFILYFIVVLATSRMELNAWKEAA